jgi:hypothetical protein
VNNAAASLPSGLPYRPLGLERDHYVRRPEDPHHSDTLRNDVALQAVHARGGLRQQPRDHDSAAAVLALVTWSQRDHPHWFGARIPDAPQSAEFVEVAAAGQTNIYRRYRGTELGEEHTAAQTAAQRTDFVLALAPARLP